MRSQHLMGGRRTLSLSQAQRVALAAQGLSRARRPGPVTARKVQSAVLSLAQLQIDSINVVQRAHYMPLFARLGPYKVEDLDRLVAAEHSSVTEYWAHEASYVDSELIPDLMLWQRRTWVTIQHELDPHYTQLREQILAELTASPGRSARELSESLGVDAADKSMNWGWNWNATKVVTEDLFARGLILALGRNSRFERRFALAEHVLDPQHRRHEDRWSALRRLVLRSIQVQGIATVHCVAEYFRLPQTQVRQMLTELVQEASVEEISVTGINAACYALPGLKVPRRIDEDLRLLAPFDSMVFNRRRLELLFDFTYRVEIYTPAAKRNYGYYVFPILCGQRFVGRIDLKAERKSGVLQVKSLHYEPSVDTGQQVGLRPALESELERLAGWLGLERVQF